MGATGQILGLRGRLALLGNSASAEVSPSDVVRSDLELPGSLKSKLQHLGPGSHVFVNMVKASLEHFADVSAAAERLVAAGFDPVPHVPAARFGSATELGEVLDSFSSVGVRQLMMIGGNDLGDRRAAGLCAYVGGAEELLEREAATLRSRGVRRVVLAGYPDGHPALGGDVEASAAVLKAKARRLLREGLDVAVATQFCFNARRLVSWLHQMRCMLRELAVEAAAEGEAKEHDASGGHRLRVSFHVGVPGPTPHAKLERITNICGVPSKPFLPSAFDLADRDADGVVSLRDLQDFAEVLGFADRGDVLQAAFERHTGPAGTMCRAEFSQLLAEDAASVDWTVLLGASEGPGPPRHVPGPSTFLTDNCTPDTVPDGAAGIAWPDEVVLAVAAYCERERVLPGEVALHVFPFGGLRRAMDLLAALRGGSWPPLATTGKAVQ